MKPNINSNMANLYLYLDMRTPAVDGTGSLKLAITHNRKTCYEPLGIRLRPEEWDKDHQQVVVRQDKKFQNVLIKKRMAEGILALQRIVLRDDYDRLEAKQILQMIVRGTDTVDRPEDLDYVLPVYNEYITLCKKPNTTSSYRSSLKNLVEYEPEIDSLRFRDMNVAWLRKYQRWLEDGKGMSVNGANVYLRNLRTIFNYALKNEYTRARYPFKDIDMGTTEPDKKTIEWDDFLEWVAYPVPDRREFYRDLFMLSFYLCGMRPVDLLNVKKSQVEAGRLVYWPEKLNGKTKLSIKIEPEAWEIIHKYEGTEHLINVMDERTDYKAFMAHWNKALKAIGKDEFTPTLCNNGKTYNVVRHLGVIPHIRVYYSRTCWSTFSYNLMETPMDVISQAFGHKSGLRVTNFYVKRSNALVDKANRELIDRLKKDLEEKRSKQVAG